MAKFTDAIRNTLIGYFNAGDQPTEAQFTDLITRIQEGIEEHEHDDTGDGDGTGTLGGPINLIDNALNSAASFYGLELSYTKTAGAGAAGDDYWGLHATIHLNQATVIDNMIAGFMQAQLTLGTLDTLYGGNVISTVEGGTVNVSVRGGQFMANIDGGVNDGTTFGGAFIVDIELAATCNDNIAAGYFELSDKDNTSTSFMIYLHEKDNVDFGIYQFGTAPHYLQGRVGIGVPAPLAMAHFDQADNAAAIPVLILDQADISEGLINFIGSARGVITGATNSTQSVRVELAGVVYRLALYVDA